MDNVTAPSWMIIDAVRYAMGRRSYQVDTTTRWVIANWKILVPSTQRIIQNDVESEFAIGERTGSWQHMGSECDRMSWERVRDLWRV